MFREGCRISVWTGQTVQHKFIGRVNLCTCKILKIFYYIYIRNLKLGYGVWLGLARPCVRPWFCSSNVIYASRHWKTETIWATVCDEISLAEIAGLVIVSCLYIVSKPWTTDNSRWGHIWVVYQYFTIPVDTYLQSIYIKRVDFLYFWGIIYISFLGSSKRSSFVGYHETQCSWQSSME